MAPELLIQISGHWSISRLPTAIVEDKEMKFHVIVYIQISEVRLDKASRRERINNMVRRSRLSTTACIDSIFDRHNPLLPFAPYTELLDKMYKQLRSELEERTGLV